MLSHDDRLMPKGKGPSLRGTYIPGTNNKMHEIVDSSFYVRHRKFFHEGRVFAVMMNETASVNSNDLVSGQDVTDYNSSQSINVVKYKDNYVYTKVRRFIVVRVRREFCYAIPIFTYSGKATTKRGVYPSEHSIAYSWGQEPMLLPGEGGITKASIAIVMAAGVANLHIASRIYYGFVHPIQYNVKVKDIGYVPKTHIPSLIGNWKAEDDNDTAQATYVTETAETPEESDEEDNDDDGGDEDEDDNEDDSEDDEIQAASSSAPKTIHVTDSMSYDFSNMNLHTS